MDLFIDNLPDKASLNDLETFFQGYSHKARFRFAHYNLPDGDKVRYAIASFENGKLALKAINKLNQRSLYGQQLLIREFIHRSYSNERRALGWRDREWHQAERRLRERRNHAAFKEVDEFEQILQSVPEEERTTETKLQVRAYQDAARKF